MTNENLKLPIWFWIVATLALLWNAFGVMIYIADVSQSPADLEDELQIVQDLYAARPAWATASFAIAVFAGLLGSICLLLKRRLAANLYVISLLALIAQNFWWFGIAKSYQYFSLSSQVVPILVFVIAVSLVLFTRSINNKGWVR